MDIRRTVIIIGLAISSYFLILAWSGDYGQKPQSKASVSVESYSNESVNEDIPDTSNTHNAQCPGHETSSLPVVQTEQDTTQQVSIVKTDALDVIINFKGGEVVGVRLPAYPAT